MASDHVLQLSDCYGLPVTTRSHEALHWYNQGLLGLLGFRSDTPDCFEKALALDPTFTMAHCHLGVHYFLEESAEMVARARHCFAQARTGGEALTDREREVVAALDLWGNGQVREAISQMQAAISARPREIILLQRLYFIYFVQGASDKLRDLPAAVLRHYDNDSYILGMYSFGLEESREFARAFEAGQQALSPNPADVWALHALAHASYEAGAFAAGVRLLEDGLQYCDHVGSFRHHMVWRLNLTGHPTPEAWQALTPSLEALRQARTYLFNQMHIALGLTGARQLEWATAYLDSLRARVRPDRPSLLGDVGVPLVEGMLAYVKGDYARVAECLNPIRQRIIDIGGSHTQREVFTDVLLDAALQTGAYDVASALIETKQRHRPARPLALFALEKVYAGQGNTAQAQATGDKARRLWQDKGADTVSV